MACQVGCTADKMTGERSSTGDKAPPASVGDIGMRCSQGDWLKQARLSRWPRGQPYRMERRQAQQAAEVQSSSPRRPREGVSVRNQLNSSRNANSGCHFAITSSAEDDRADEAEARTRDHGSATRPRSRMSCDDVTVERAAGANVPGSDLDSRRRSPTRAAAPENPEFSLSVWLTYQV